jgi:hypothetical protein
MERFKLYDAIQDALDPLAAWANEKNIGQAEWQRRSGIIETLKDALARARGEEQSA